jgi:hypothetical protein
MPRQAGSCLSCQTLGVIKGMRSDYVRIISAAFASLLLANSDSIAQTTQRQVVIASFEDTSCGAWVKSKDDPAVREVYLFWFRGYVSGFNYGSKTHQVPAGAVPDHDTLSLYIDKFCRDRPLSPFVNAAQFLVHELGVKRSK